ncbi:helix-turn-helix domain-containing protein [Amycolatopsis pigmentata]|uniref:Helix-turn-helix domain-containing protein n=1 Tax=Amycolatopsis pigmentata TaxID=450801 RepID=A0ABW5FTF9_9PSEU
MGDDDRRGHRGVVDAAPPEAPPGRRLAAGLRQAKQSAGRSYADLECRTPYSRSSLERYINGKLFPTRDAVRAIAEACEVDPLPLLRLWEECQPPQALPAASQPTETPVAPRLTGPWAWLAVLVVVIVVVGSAVVVIWSRDAGKGPPPSVPPGVAHGEPGDWSREISTRTTDAAVGSGWLAVTLRWRGNGPYDGEISGSLYQRGGGGSCAVAYAGYDGMTTMIGQTCGEGTSVTVADSFQRIQHAVVRVCLRSATTKQDVFCGAWS